MLSKKCLLFYLPLFNYYNINKHSKIYYIENLIIMIEYVKHQFREFCYIVGLTRAPRFGI